jgi:hypothetical protein
MPDSMNMIKEVMITPMKIACFFAGNFLFCYLVAACIRWRWPDDPSGTKIRQEVDGMIRQVTSNN